MRLTYIRQQRNLPGNIIGFTREDALQSLKDYELEMYRGNITKEQFEGIKVVFEVIIREHDNSTHWR